VVSGEFATFTVAEECNTVAAQEDWGQEFIASLLQKNA